MAPSYAVWALVMAPVVCQLMASKWIIHFFQLESYQFPGYFNTIARNKSHSLLPGLICSGAMVLLYYLFDLTALRSDAALVKALASVMLIAASALAGYIIMRSFAPKKVKKKFVATGRVKRLYVVFALCLTLLSYLLSKSPAAILPALLPLALPLTVALSGLLAWPLEKLISEMYFRDARRKLLSMPNLTRIGVTGSYGKTTVKHILGTILSEKYPTFITPASFNTPMGVTRAIREGLTPSYRVFVAEMGARHVGDIKEMCRLVKPGMGVLTSVGPQHLETFKTLERVTRTKYELIEALPEGSRGFFPDDGGICRELYDRTKKPKTLVSMTNADADAYASDISVSSEGSSFTLHIKGKGEIECTTRLLGEHNIQNILLAAAVSDSLGLTMRQISRGISKLSPVTARLELINVPGSYTIINDGFNANPAGAKHALKVLSGFPKRRIIITPGMVELGEKEAMYNRELGEAIAKSADIAILIGKKRVQPIVDGLLAGGFPESAIHRAPSLDESTALLASIVRGTDTVLYENDLPDNYREA